MKRNVMLTPIVMDNLATTGGGADTLELWLLESRRWRHGDSTVDAANDNVWRNAA